MCKICSKAKSDSVASSIVQGRADVRGVITRDANADPYSNKLCVCIYILYTHIYTHTHTQGTIDKI